LSVAPARRTVVSVKVASIIGLALIGAVTLGGPAAAQGKDPFRPPAGTGESGTGGTTGVAQPGVGIPVEPTEPRMDGGLPRTGLDYSLPVLLAFALMAAGASLRVVTYALAP
jgi:hypothetical protein